MAQKPGESVPKAKQSKPQSFRAGDIVVECEPWVWSFEWNNHSNFCAHCCKASSDLRTCTACRLYRYCSTNCQREDWKKEHKLECPVLNRVGKYRQEIEPDPEYGRLVAHIRKSVGYEGDSSFFSTNILMLLKIMNRIVKTGKSDDMNSPTVVLQRFLYDPQSSLLRNAVTKIVQMKFFQGLLKAVFDEPVMPESKIVDLLSRVDSNLFILMDLSTGGLPRVLGAGLFPDVPKTIMAAVCSDHDVVVVCHGKRLRLYAMDDIPRYTGLYNACLCEPDCFPLTWPLKQRREMFKKKFTDDCNCRKCSPEYDAEVNPMKCATTGCSERIPSDDRALQPCPQCGAVNEANLHKLKKLLASQEVAFETCLVLEEAGNMDAQLPHKLRVLEELDNADILQPEAHLRFVCGWHAARFYEGTKRYEEAWKLYHEMVACVRIIYPKYHPHRALCLRSAGHFPLKWFSASANILRNNPEEQARLLPMIKKTLPEAMVYLKEALEIDSLLYGKECKVASETAAALDAEKVLYAITLQVAAIVPKIMGIALGFRDCLLGSRCP